ncbi:MAG: hypothetical protein AAFO58_13365, partial [Pseudomonadota bacterium]
KRVYVVDLLVDERDFVGELFVQSVIEDFLFEEILALDFFAFFFLRPRLGQKLLTLMVQFRFFGNEGFPANLKSFWLLFPLHIY